MYFEYITPFPWDLSKFCYRIESSSGDTQFTYGQKRTNNQKENEGELIKTTLTIGKKDEANEDNPVDGNGMQNKPDLSAL